METYLDFYDKEGEFKHSLIDKYYYDSILSLFPREKIKTILDVGCGDGNLCNLIKGVGIDISKNRLSHAHLQYKKCNFLQGSGYNIPFKNNSFDIVTSIEVIEHLKDPYSVIVELKRVSSKYVLIQVPYNEVIKEEICIHCLKPQYPRGHIHSFNEKRLQSICDDTGLKIIKMDFFFHAFDNKFIKCVPSFLLRKIKKSVFIKLIKHGGYIGILCKK